MIRRLTIVATVVGISSACLPLARVSAAPAAGGGSVHASKQQIEDRVIVGIQRGARTEAVEQVKDAGADVVDYNPDGRFLVVEAPMEAEELAAEIESTDSVLYVEPDHVVTAADLGPTQSEWNELWGMERIGAPAAWANTTGSKEIIVGVVDSGVDYTHPDLATQMWVNEGEDPNTPADDDHNGWVNDVHGADCANDDGDPMDDHSHGTHVAGTIGAAANGTGVVGVASEVRIMALKFLGADNWGYFSDAIECLYYAIDNGAHVTNHSWYGTDYSQALYDAIAEAGDRNQLFVAAAGNESADNDSEPHYPASFDLDNVISVAATDSNDGLASFSNYGAASVDLAAPGVGIVSSVPGGYASYSGTSMAAPHVTGALALLLATDPTFQSDAGRLRSALLNHTDSIPALAGSVATGGRLNVAASLAAASPLEAKVMHIDDLEGSSTDIGKRGWKASMVVTVTDAGQVVSGGVKVIVSWSVGGMSSCVTSPAGTCSTSSARLRKTTDRQTVGSIQSITADGFTHDRTSDIDSAQDGLRIKTTVSKGR